MVVDADHNTGTPILSEKLDFVGGKNDKIIDSSLQVKRREAFDRFQTVVESLAGFENSDKNSNMVSLVWHSDREVDDTGVIPVNSLLFQVRNSADTVMPIVVVIPSNRKVDVRKLQMHLEDDSSDDERNQSITKKIKCSMVPADQVEALCGFPPLSVPPIGHFPHTLPILVDESLYQDDTILRGGGGHPKIGCLIAAETLLRVEGTELADLTKDMLLLDTTSEDGTTRSDQEQQLAQSAKSYFQLAPPPTKEAQHVVTHPGESNHLAPEPITLVGRVNGIRRMARRLAFIDIAPPGFLGTGTKVDSYVLPWKSVLDDQEMSVQLIIGKTFCKHRGDKDGTEAMKRLKIGQLILVEGKTNVGNRESLRHWCDKRSFDIVVFDFRILEEPPPKDLRLAQTSMSLKRRPLQKQHSLQPGTSSPSTKISSEALNYLQLSDLFAGKTSTKIVDNSDSITEFESDLENLPSNINGDNTPILTGIDCEWKPSFLLNQKDDLQPVLLLQVSLQKLNTVYLWDLQALLRSCQGPLEGTNNVESLASETLSKLFGSPKFLKVGFQLIHDLRKLASSYPHIPAFRTFVAVAEVSSIAKTVMQIENIENRQKSTSSLSRLTKQLLAKPMNKGQQVSDWSIRPLSSAQQEYAALDAAVTPVLLEKSLALTGAAWIGNVRLGRKQDDAFFADSVSSIRFLLAKDLNADTVSELKAKKVLPGYWLVTQEWTTGQNTPSPPSILATSDILCHDVAEVLQ